MVEISLIIPVYNGATFIERMLVKVQAYLSEFCDSYEIIVVDDGSVDATYEVLKALELSELKVLRLERNQGKGAAVRCGMLEARGKCCAFTDADIPYDLGAIKEAYRHIVERDFHVVLGDRTLLGSTYYEHLSAIRYVATRGFSMIVRLLVTGEAYDTQCGFKAFRNDVAKELFSMGRLTQFAFDVELIYIALKYNLEIRKIPVRFVHSEPSSVRLVGHGLQMFQAICRLPFLWHQGKYENEYLRALGTPRYWN